MLEKAKYQIALTSVRGKERHPNPKVEIGRKAHLEDGCPRYYCTAVQGSASHCPNDLVHSSKDSLGR